MSHHGGHRVLNQRDDVGDARPLFREVSEDGSVRAGRVAICGLRNSHAIFDAMPTRHYAWVRARTEIAQHRREGRPGLDDAHSVANPQSAVAHMKPPTRVARIAPALIASLAAGLGVHPVVARAVAPRHHGRGEPHDRGAGRHGCVRRDGAGREPARSRRRLW